MSNLATVTEIRPKPEKRPLRPMGLTSHQPSIAVTGTWTPRRARDAVDANDSGYFALIIQARTSMTRDPRIAGARLQRIAAPLDQELCVEPAEGYESKDLRSPSGRLCSEVEALFDEGGPLAYPIRSHWEGELADFGLSIAIQYQAPSAGGGEWTPVVEPWPLDATRIDPTTGALLALHDGGEEPITPGDGRWIMVRASLMFPWLEGSVRCALEAWLARAFSNRDASRFSESAGQNPIIGTVPDNADPADVAQFFDDGKRITTGHLGANKREGFAWERLASNAEQAVNFEKNEARASRDGAIAYLGQDGTAAKGSTGTYGAVKVLDGVRFDLIQRDCMALAGGQNDVIRPYVYYNHGDTRLCPRAYYNVPDPEETARELAEHTQARDDRAAFMKEIQALKSAGVALTKEMVEEIAHSYEVTLSPTLAEALAMGQAPKPPPALPAQAAP